MKKVAGQVARPLGLVLAMVVAIVLIVSCTFAVFFRWLDN